MVFHGYLPLPVVAEDAVEVDQVRPVDLEKTVGLQQPDKFSNIIRADQGAVAGEE